MAEDQDKGFTVRDRRFWVTEDKGENGSSASTEGQAPSPEYPSYVEQLRSEAAEKDRQLREYIAAYKEQVVKGIEDTKERLRRENEREVERLKGRLVEDLLGVLDNLDRSLQAAAQSKNIEAFVQGVELVRQQFVGKLSALGLAKMETVGTPFDPAAHEAIGIVPVTDPAQDGRVVAEVQSGYKLGERVLRPALVQVGKATQS
jgi:molecular chaperone GrpE